MEIRNQSAQYGTAIWRNKAALFYSVLCAFLAFLPGIILAQSFSNVAGSANVADSGNGRGVAWGDYDSDGDLDLYLANEGTNRLFRNNNNGTFSNVAGSANVADGGTGAGVTWGDYDNDGDLDIYMTNGPGTNRLYRNNGDGTFSNIAGSANVDDGSWAYAVTWGDYDNDGDPDLFMGSESYIRLYRNNGNDTFTDVAGSVGVYGTAAFGAAWADYDNDEDLDLYIASSSTNRLFRNNGDGTFSDVTGSAGVSDGAISMGVTWGDYDNDGDADFYVTSREVNRLFRNNGNGAFSNVASSVNAAGVAWWSRGAAWADYDRDGDLDIYVANGWDVVNWLFRNNGTANRWLHVELTGTVSNRSGIGARVTAVTGSTRQRRDVGGGEGYWSQSSLPVEFGFGSTTTVDELTIHWPSGNEQTLNNVATNQLLAVTELANVPPVADAGPDREVEIGATVQLDGSGSSDPDEDPRAYGWSFTEKPVGSAATLSDPASVNPTFVADVPGEYMVQLIVNDGTVDSDPDLVAIATFEQFEMALGLDHYPDMGGYVEIRDHAQGNYDHLHWTRVRWESYNRSSGETRPALGDVDGDGLDEIVIGLDSNGSGYLEVLDDAEAGHAHLQWLVIPWSNYNSANGETWPAVGDIDGDGLDEIVVGLGPNGGSGYLAIFDDASANYAFLRWLRVPWSSYRSANGETRPALGDIDGDGSAEIVVGLGPNEGKGYMMVFDDASTDHASLKWLSVPWSSYRNSNGETWPALGDVDGDGLDEILMGLGASGGGRCCIVDDANANYAFLKWLSVPWGSYCNSNGETRPAAGDTDGDGRAEVVVGLGAGGGGWVAVFEDANLNFAFDRWRQVPFSSYNADMGSSRPAIGNLVP